MLPHHFEHPQLLWLLLPLLAFVWYLSKTERKQSTWELIADRELIYPLLIAPEQKRRIGYILLAVLWLLTVLALSGPSFQPTKVPLYQNQQATVLVASLNDTMLANDLPPSRLVRMRYKLLDTLKQYGDGQIGLIAFSGEPYVVSPLTQDSNTIANLVADLSPDIMPVAGNQLSAALLLAQKTLLQSGTHQGHIVVFTADPADAAAIDTAKQLADAGITISVLGMATPLGAPLLAHMPGSQGANPVVMSRLDSSSLEALANAGQGQFSEFTNNNADLSTVLAIPISTAMNKTLLAANTTQTTCSSDQNVVNQKTCANEATFWHNQGYWLVWLCIPFVLFAFRRGSPWLEIV